MNLSHADQIVLILAGTIVISVAAAVGAYIYESRKSREKSSGTRNLDPSVRNLEQWFRKLGIEFDPKDPNDPVSALIAAGEYFRMPGCEPGGPHYEETFQRVIHMIEDMVPPDRLDFWVDQVYRLYGSQYLSRVRKKKDPD